MTRFRFGHRPTQASPVETFECSAECIAKALKLFDAHIYPTHPKNSLLAWAHMQERGIWRTIPDVYLQRYIRGNNEVVADFA